MNCKHLGKRVGDTEIICNLTRKPKTTSAYICNSLKKVCIPFWVPNRLTKPIWDAREEMPIVCQLCDSRTPAKI